MYSRLLVYSNTSKYHEDQILNENFSELKTPATLLRVSLNLCKVLHIVINKNIKKIAQVSVILSHSNVPMGTHECIQWNCWQPKIYPTPCNFSVLKIKFVYHRQKIDASNLHNLFSCQPCLCQSTFRIWVISADNRKKWFVKKFIKMLNLIWVYCY